MRLISNIDKSRIRDRNATTANSTRTCPLARRRPSLRFLFLREVTAAFSCSPDDGWRWVEAWRECPEPQNPTAAVTAGRCREHPRETEPSLFAPDRAAAVKRP